MNDLRVTVAIPLFNEQETVRELISRVKAVLDQLPGASHEIIAVDDGSVDETAGLLAESDVGDHDLVIVKLSRNFGHQAALSSAIEQSSGDVVVLMDGDLQDPPEAIPAMLEKYYEGNEVVYAVRTARKESWYLRLAYATFYRVMRLFASIEMPLDAGDFSLISRPVVDAIRSSPEHHRYIRGLRAWAGFRQTGIPVPREARGGGRSKYSLSRLLALAVDGLFSFSNIPLRFASIIGFMTVLGSFVFTLYALFAKFVLGASPRGFTALIVVIVFVSGVQLMFLGIIGEYVGRIYSETKGRPNYVIREIIHRSR